MENNNNYTDDFIGGTYIGPLNNGKAHGYGAYKFEDGTAYVGMWSNGKSTGYFYIVDNNYISYYGIYKNGKMIRHGKQINSCTGYIKNEVTNLELKNKNPE